MESLIWILILLPLGVGLIFMMAYWPKPSKHGHVLILFQLITIAAVAIAVWIHLIKFILYGF